MIWALSRQKDRDAALAKTDAILALPHTGPNAFVAYEAALERAAQTAIRYGASLHVVEAIRDLKALSHTEQPIAWLADTVNGRVVFTRAEEAERARARGIEVVPLYPAAHTEQPQEGGRDWMLVCRNHIADIPYLRDKIHQLFSGQSIGLNGIERDIIVAGLNLVLEALSASPPPPVAEREWQPIETAPKGRNQSSRLRWLCAVRDVLARRAP